MKKFWKVSANAVLAAALVSSVALVTPAQAATVSQDFSQVQVDTKLKNNVLTNISAMSAYITTGEDGLLRIDQNAVNIVGKETFEVYERGVASLNKAISTEDIKIANGTLVVDKSQLTIPSGSQISPAAYGSFYWWGYALTLTQQESANLAYNLTQSGTVMAAAAAISGLIPTPPTKLVQAIAYAVSLGVGLLANKINFENKGNGVTLNIHYVGFINVTSNP
ncbi:hypothetical protein ABEX47_04145 [Paenibacillus ehimensis]|uniref:hypothetical protein n=1 Tax=Paenibacillus ehimensis TaxID=79264 RepID=UPI000FD88343|nr:hypothetical protein [Paenibacillus ehimensis]MEC0207437.1 hypothetical protein [Paenibacillus ehimensis]